MNFWNKKSNLILFLSVWVVLVAGLTSGFNPTAATTNWDDYDWDSELIELGPELNPDFMNVELDGAESCRDAIEIIYTQIWNSLSKLVAGNFDEEERIFKVIEKFYQIQSNYNCPAGGHYLLLFDQRGAVRVACSRHDLHLPSNSAGMFMSAGESSEPPSLRELQKFIASKSRWPQQIRYPQFDLSGQYWIQEREEASKMKIDTHIIDLGANTLSGNPNLARFADEIGATYHPASEHVNLDDLMLKSISPDKYYLQLAEQLIDNHSYFQALQQLAEVYRNSSAASETRHQADKLYFEMLSEKSQPLKIMLPPYLLLSVQIFNQQGQLAGPNDYSAETKQLFQFIENFQEKTLSTSSFLTVTEKLKPLTERGYLKLIRPFVADSWLIQTLDHDFKPVLWQLGPGINRRLELKFDQEIFQQGTIPNYLWIENELYLLALPSQEGFEQKMSVLAAFNEPFEGRLNESDPQVKEILNLLSQRIYKIPIEKIEEIEKNEKVLN